MKRILLGFFAILFLIGYTRGEGWRIEEQQVVIQIANQSQLFQLNELKINFEPCGFQKIRAYLIPKERNDLETLGFNIETEIADLNKYFSTFWLTEDFYHSYQQIIDLADSLETHFPGICKKHIFGTSLGGRQLAALKISDNVLTDEPEAEVFFDGGIHGDEIGGSENIIRFARDLCLGYGTNGVITNMIDNREIWLYLMVNPDGRVNMVRYNNNGVDLNRDCGYMWDQDGTTFGPFGEVESKALRDCNLQNQFVIYTSYHSGTEFVSYPWSYRPDATPDQLHINQLALLYVNESGYSNLPYGQGYSGMYPINGSSKDAYYGITGSISWSIEISVEKQPPASQILTYYNYNKPAMLALIEYSAYGLQGTITDAATGEPVAASVFVNSYYPCYSDPEAGDYHKYVLPGTYSITVKANGYEPQTISNVTVTANNTTTTDFQLIPSQGMFGYKFLASRIPNNNFSDEGNTSAAIGPPDNINYSLGKNGYCILDMQFPVLDGPGNDIIIHEGDNSPEGYSCHVGSTMDGPWVNIGTGTGTTEFDLSLSGLSEIQYIKIMDDGDGTANAANAGFDLDAIEGLEPVSGVYLVILDYSVDDVNGNNNGMMDSGETVDINITLKNNGNENASDIGGAISALSPFVTIIDPDAFFGTLAQGEAGQGSFTVSISEATPPGYSFSAGIVVTANYGTYTNVFTLNFQVGLVVEDWETGDFSQYEWQTSGNSNWTITNASPYEGIYCAKSGNISHSQSSYLEISYEVIAGGEISFFKKVSSESGYDFLNFYIDNTLQEGWSGEVAWSESSYPVNTGLHSFKWEYMKDGSVVSGSDCAWLDYILLPSGANQTLIAYFTADQTEVCEGAIVNFTDFSTGNITSWNWSFPGGTPASSTLQNPTIGYSSAGLYDVSLTISNGSDSQTFTQNDYISVTTIPQAPPIPFGNTWPESMPDMQYEYTIIEVTYAESYEWIAEPGEAIDSLINNGSSCIIDFTDWYWGNVLLKVKAINDCGESEFSNELTLFVTCESVNENHPNKFIISPNPSDGLINIDFEFPGDEKLDIRILNTLGKIIYQENVTLPDSNRSCLIDIRNMEAGIYLMMIKNGDEVATQKVIIK